MIRETAMSSYKEKAKTLLKVFFLPRETERLVVDNGEDVLLNLKNPTQRVPDPDSNNALVIEFNKEEDLEIEIPKVHSKTDAKNFVVCLDLKNLEEASLRIDVELLGDESNLKEVKRKRKTQKSKKQT